MSITTLNEILKFYLKNDLIVMCTATFNQTISFTEHLI